MAIDGIIQSTLIPIFGALGTTVDAVVPSTNARGLLTFSADDLTRQFENEGLRFNSNNLTPEKAAKGSNSYISTLSFPLDVGDDDSFNIGHFIMMLMGKVTKVGSAPNFTHIFSLVSATRAEKQLKDLNLAIAADKENFENEYTGAKVNTLSLASDVESNIVEVAAEIWALKENSFTVPTSSNFSDENIIGGKDVKIEFDGVDVDVKNLTVTISRDLEYARVLRNSPDPKDIITKGLLFTISGSAIFSDASNTGILNKFRSTTPTTVTVKISYFDSADNTNRFLEIESQRMILDTVTGPNATGEEIVMIDFNGSHVGPDQNITITLGNSFGDDYDQLST